MKIRFLKTTSVDVESRSGEIYDKSFSRWDEIQVEGIYPYGKFATIKLIDDTILHGVPAESFEKLVEEKRTVTI